MNTTSTDVTGFCYADGVKAETEVPAQRTRIIKTQQIHPLPFLPEIRLYLRRIGQVEFATRHFSPIHQAYNQAIKPDAQFLLHFSPPFLSLMRISLSRLKSIHTVLKKRLERN